MKNSLEYPCRKGATSWQPVKVFYFIIAGEEVHSVHYWKVNLINFGSDKRLFISCIQPVSYNHSTHLSNFRSAWSTNKFRSCSMIRIFWGFVVARWLTIRIVWAWVACDVCVVCVICTHMVGCELWWRCLPLGVVLSNSAPVSDCRIRYLSYPIPPESNEYLAALLGKSQAGEQSQIRNNFWW